MRVVLRPLRVFRDEHTAYNAPHILVYVSKYFGALPICKETNLHHQLLCISSYSQICASSRIYDRQNPENLNLYDLVYNLTKKQIANSTLENLAHIKNTPDLDDILIYISGDNSPAVNFLLSNEKLSVYYDTNLAAYILHDEDREIQSEEIKYSEEAVEKINKQFIPLHSIQIEKAGPEILETGDESPYYYHDVLVKNQDLSMTNAFHRRYPNVSCNFNNRVVFTPYSANYCLAISK